MIIGTIGFAVGVLDTAGDTRRPKLTFRRRIKHER